MKTVTAVVNIRLIMKRIINIIRMVIIRMIIRMMMMTMTKKIKQDGLWIIAKIINESHEKAVQENQYG
jgi:hypothetical protein